MTLRILRRSLALSIVVLALSWAAHAAAPVSCSGSVGGTAAAIAFGSQSPQQYVTIFNASATVKFWINVVGGTAAANTAGSFPLESEGNNVTLPPFPSISIISSGGSQPYTCFYQ